MIRIALAQYDFLVGDITGNVAKARRCMAEAKNADARILLFPELALTGYPPEDLLLRPRIHVAGSCRARITGQ